ncbi:MAG TPA: riboflavin kinase [Acidisarcina sp.]
MRVYRSLAEISPGPTVVTIGNFDGVHCGHRWILNLIEERARVLSCSFESALNAADAAAAGAAGADAAAAMRPAAVRAVAVTFDPHPSRLLRPEDSPRLITPLESRLRLLEGTGVDAVLVLPFTPELSRMSGEEFVTAILRDALHAVEVHEGENFRFGHRAHCDTAVLEALGVKLGFRVEIHSARHVRGMLISSSRVRQCILAGEMGNARALLGRPFSIDSTAATGRGIGSRLTVPTINLAPYDELVPADGVYITRLRAGGGRGSGGRIFDAVTNAGRRPTFGEESYAIESYLLDYDAAIDPLELTPETPLELTFLRRLREERRFASPELLRAQIFRDVAKAKRYFQLWRLVGSKRKLERAHSTAEGLA